MADWQAIKTEYITTDTSYRKLAEKYGIHHHVIAERGKAENWVELRRQYRDKTLAKTLEKCSERQSNKLSRIDYLADKLLNKLEKACDELDLVVITRKVKVETGNMETTTEYRETKEGGTVDRAGLRMLTTALKDLKEVKMIRSELDEQEQLARIDNLRKQANREDSKTGTVTVVLEGGLEDYAQ